MLWRLNAKYITEVKDLNKLRQQCVGSIDGCRAFVYDIKAVTGLRVKQQKGNLDAQKPFVICYLKDVQRISIPFDAIPLSFPHMFEKETTESYKHQTEYL